MRIDRLDFVAFGPFSGQSLRLDDGDQGLHIVYGTNEAGKSSALRALTQLLFGIPHNCSDNFVHPHASLRVGARLQGADGEALECIRRKGKGNTLRGADDVTAIDAARLSRLLGGLDECTFSQQFGINCQSLAKGGRAIVEGHGEIGAALFAAGSGIVDLRRIQDKLIEEAEALFLPRGKVQRINRALADLDKAKKQIKEAQLPTAEWAAHDSRLKDAQRRKAAIEQQLLERCAQRSRLERIAAALPHVARRQQALAGLAEVAAAPLLAEDFAERRRAAVDHLHRAQLEFQELTAHREQLRRKIVELHVPPGILEHRETIKRLFEQLGAYRKAQLDRPQRVIEKQLHEDAARSNLRELGQPADLQNVEGLRLSRAERQQVQMLSQDQRNVESRWVAAAELVGKLQGAIAQCERDLTAMSPLYDSAQLRHALQAAGAHGDVEKRITQARANLARLEQQAAIDLDRLQLWKGSLAELEKLPTPTSETVDRFDEERTAANLALHRTEERTAEVSNGLAQIEQNLERLRLARDVPTEEDLAAARKRREEGWRLVRQAWEAGRDGDGEAEVATSIGRAEPVNSLADAYEISVQEADGIADRLRREAENVAQKAQLIADREALAAQLVRLSSQRELEQRRLSDIQERWKTLWQPLAIDPLTPREMRAWLQQHASLASAAAEVRRQCSELHELEACMTACHSNLVQALARCGQAAPEAASLAGLMQHAEEAVASLTQQLAERRSLQADRVRLGNEVQSAQQQLELSHEQRNAWREQWRQVTWRLNQPESTSPAAVNQVMECLSELFDKLKEAELLQRRIEGIDRDAEAFAEQVRTLSSLLGEELGQRPLDVVVDELHHRFEKAQDVQARREVLWQQQEREEKQFERLQSAIGQLQASLSAMCAEAGVEKIDDLQGAEERSARRRNWLKESKDAETRIVELSAGAKLPAFLAEIASVTADELQPTIDKLAEEVRQLNQQKEVESEAIGSATTELHRMDGSSLAAQAQEEATALAAQIQTDAEQYRRLRLASAVLRTAIERYREKHQGPVVKRASELFERLTLGSFDGLRADYDDANQLVLVGVRAEGRHTVSVECMSDGARDQLYLALRLASLHTYLESREPIPFIVDDILIQFDDERAGAALEALAELSARTQVIFFTHHEHLVNLAATRLPGDVVFTHVLDCRTLPAAPLAATPLAAVGMV